MRTNRFRAGLMGLLILPALSSLAAVAPAAAASEWQNGTHDEDQIIDCLTQAPGTGISADVSWRGNSDRVPRIGETFYVRGYAGLVSLPCSGKAAVLPEFLIPTGLEYADDATHPVRWSFTAPGQQPQLSTEQLTYDLGTNGGVLFGTPDGEAWTMRQGYILEIQVPVRATRELKGPATQQPECQDRRRGIAPCPVGQSGDHLQVAFTVGGHGGDKYYVTPYVGLFASNASNPGNPGNPGNPVGKAASSTTAKFSVSRKAKGRAVVTVRSSVVATGKVVVSDRGRAIGSATVRSGRAVVTLPKLRRGKHVLTVRYAGSSTVKPSQSAPRKITVH